MPSRNVGGGRGASTFSYRASLNSTVICRLSRNARGRRHPATQNNIKETTSSAYIVADASDLFVVWLRSNSKAAIPHATVGTAAPTTNIRTEMNTAWATCARTTASSLEMAAIISATQARKPITLRAIRDQSVSHRTLLTEPGQLWPTAPCSFDHLVGAYHQCYRHLEPDCPCGLEVDDQLEFRRLLYRKTGGTSAAKNFVDVDGSATIKVGVVRPIRDQPSGIDVLLRDVDCGQPMTRRQLRDKASIFLRESVDADNEPVYML